MVGTMTDSPCKLRVVISVSLQPFVPSYLLPTGCSDMGSRHRWSGVTYWCPLRGVAHSSTLAAGHPGTWRSSEADWDQSFCEMAEADSAPVWHQAWHEFSILDWTTFRPHQHTHLCVAVTLLTFLCSVHWKFLFFNTVDMYNIVCQDPTFCGPVLRSILRM